MTLVTDQEITALGVASQSEVDEMRETGRRVFAILEEAWADLDVTLVDCKIEFGRAVSDGSLLVADVIDNDSWRIWPGGDKNRMLDKQVFRNMPKVTDAGLADSCTSTRRSPGSPIASSRSSGLRPAAGQRRPPWPDKS